MSWGWSLLADSTRNRNRPMARTTTHSLCDHTQDCRPCDSEASRFVLKVCLSKVGNVGVGGGREGGRVAWRSRRRFWLLGSMNRGLAPLRCSCRAPPIQGEFRRIALVLGCARFASDGKGTFFDPRKAPRITEEPRLWVRWGTDVEPGIPRMARKGPARSPGRNRTEKPRVTLVIRARHPRV